MKQYQRGIGGRAPHDREIYGVPCKNPEKHKDTTHTEDGVDECWYCVAQWYEALPWVRSSLDALRFDDDKALTALLRLPEDTQKKRRLTVVYKNCWEHLEDRQGYIAEVFCIEMGESKDPDSYPYWRVAQAARPNMMLPILRERICYEPQIKDCPIYLEVATSGFNRDLTMHGLDSIEDLSLSSLEPLLRVRDWLMDKDNNNELDLLRTARYQRGRKPRDYAAGDADRFERDAIKVHLDLAAAHSDSYKEYKYSQERIAPFMGFETVQGWCKRTDRIGVDRDRLKKKAVSAAALRRTQS